VQEALIMNFHRRMKLLFFSNSRWISEKYREKDNT
jgi:hypothetical protein